MPAMRIEKPKSFGPVLLLVLALGGILVTALVMAVDVWSGSGDTGMSHHGYIAMTLGAVATLALGGGLMALVFFSSRRGYDDAVAPGDDADGRR